MRFAPPRAAMGVVCHVSGRAAAVRSTPSAQQAPRPIADPNVNMVRGITLPTGDPFMQRQNEPSIAVSTRNPCHLVAGANDYRSVDIPFDNTPPPNGESSVSLAGDAWLGLFKSFDCGQKWSSTLLPGFPQDNSTVGLPLKGYEAGADPTVRAGLNGLFYYSGMVFNRGLQGLSKISSPASSTTTTKNAAIRFSSSTSRRSTPGARASSSTNRGLPSISRVVRSGRARRSVYRRRCATSPGKEFQPATSTWRGRASPATATTTRS